MAPNTWTICECLQVLLNLMSSEQTDNQKSSFKGGNTCVYDFHLVKVT